MALVGVCDSTAAARLDVEIRRLQTQLMEATERASDAEKRATSLEQRSRSAKIDVEDDIKAKDRIISLLTSHLERAERDVEVANSEKKDLAKQLRMVKLELDRYVARFRSIEKVYSKII